MNVSTSESQQALPGAVNVNPAVPRDTPPKPGSIPLRNLSRHPFNRSCGEELDRRYIDRLARSISDHRLMHPVVLVPDPNTPGRYWIVAGAHRVAALLDSRGQAGVLEPGEYIVRDDLKPDSEDCLKIAVEENSMRRGTSPAALGRYINRLTEKTGKTQEEVGKLLHLQRETVSALSGLSKHLDKLPESWRRDLAVSEGDEDCDSENRPAITITHWRQIKARVEQEGMSDGVMALMESAARERWSAARLRDELNGTKAGEPRPLAADSGAPSPGTGEPVTPGDKAAGKDAGPGATTRVQGGAPDYPAMLEQLVRVLKLADGDREAAAIVDRAIDELTALQKTRKGGAQAGTPAEAA